MKIEEYNPSEFSYVDSSEFVELIIFVNRKMHLLNELIRNCNNEEIVINLIDKRNFCEDIKREIDVIILDKNKQNTDSELFNLRKETNDLEKVKTHEEYNLNRIDLLQNEKELNQKQIKKLIKKIEEMQKKRNEKNL